MKNCLYKILAFLTLFAIFAVSVCAEEDNTAKSWYYKRNGRGTPSFPEDAEFVKEHSGYFVGDSSEKKIYITFDAGYENGNIERILDILKEKDVPAAFFILKNLILKNPTLIQRMSNEGHLVCNHTKNHKDMTTLTEEEMVANLKFLEDLCLKETGVEMVKYFRFPEGRYSKRTLLTAEKNGYKTIFWSLSHKDWDNDAQPNCNDSIKHLCDNIHNGAIILLHPTSCVNVEILPILIDRWKEEGYSFGKLSEL